MRVVVHYLDGTTKEFPHQHRPGGSYTNRVRSEGAFLIVTDAWDAETWIPADKIDCVETHPARGGW